MDRETFLQQVFLFWNALCEGDEEEKQISNFLYFVYVKLQEKWFGIKKQIFYPSNIKEDIDTEEYYLNNCIADF